MMPKKKFMTSEQRNMTSEALIVTSEELATGLGSVSSFVQLLKKGLQIDFALRTSVGACFDPHDGRRQAYSDPKPELAPDDKRADHLFFACDSWGVEAPQIAACILRMRDAVQAADAEHLEQACHDTMAALMQLELVGRECG